MAIGVKFNEQQNFDIPAFAAEPFTANTLMPGGAIITATAFDYRDALVVTVGAAGAAVDATSVPVTIVSPLGRSGLKIPADTTLDFGGDKFATLTAEATVGDTTITVRALVTALVQDDTDTYNGTELVRHIPAGTIVGRTYAERDAGTAFGKGDVDTPDDQLFLTAFDVPDAVESPYIVLLRHNTRIYEDKLPGWSGLSATAKAAIRSRYETIISAQ
ncbi:MAG: hypothetical protein AAFX78_04905 [Cyanobacteria bacterium J06638_20]